MPASVGNNEAVETKLKVIHRVKIVRLCARVTAVYECVCVTAVGCIGVG